MVEEFYRRRATGSVIDKPNIDMNGYEMGRMLFFESAQEAFKRTANDNKMSHLKKGGGPITPADMEKRRKQLANQYESSRQRKMIQKVNRKRKVVMKKSPMSHLHKNRQAPSVGTSTTPAGPAPKQAATPTNRVSQAGAQAGSGTFMKHLKKNRLAYGAGALGLGAMSMLN